MKPFSKILVAVDFSPHSDEAIGYAADVARRYQAPLTLVHAYQPLAHAMPEGFGTYAPDYLARVLTECRKQLDAAKLTVEAATTFGVETRLVQGDVASEIVQLASESGHDLIVMGTHGRTGATHLLMGSIAEKVVRRAPCPVLTVHPAKHHAA